jgi:4-hydroxy-tetrahydrodipicolinate synthase
MAGRQTMTEAQSTASLSRRLKGLLPVVPTPLDEDESLDEHGVERLAEFTLRYPFSGIWALASAGEDENLSPSLIDQCARLFVRHFSGEIPVLVKTCRPGTRATVERTKRMADFGIDGAIVHFQHKRLGAEHARRHFNAVADASPVPVLIYHNATRGAQLDVELILELSHHPNIVGMKAGGSNLAELQRLCLFAADDFAVMTAGGGQILAGLAMGAAAHTAIPLLAFPERAFAVHDHVVAGNLPAARAEQKVISDFLIRMPKLHNREVSGEVKCVLEIRRVIKRHVSAPFVEATPEQKGEFERLSEELDLFAASEAAGTGAGTDDLPKQGNEDSTWQPVKN